MIYSILVLEEGLLVIVIFFFILRKPIFGYKCSELEHIYTGITGGKHPNILLFLRVKITPCVSNLSVSSKANFGHIFCSSTRWVISLIVFFFPPSVSLKIYRRKIARGHQKLLITGKYLVYKIWSLRSNLRPEEMWYVEWAQMKSDLSISRSRERCIASLPLQKTGKGEKMAEEKRNGS